MLNKGVWVLNSMAPLDFEGLLLRLFSGMDMVRKTGGRVIMVLEAFCQIPSSWGGLEILFVILNFYHVSFLYCNSAGLCW